MMPWAVVGGGAGAAAAATAGAGFLLRSVTGWLRLALVFILAGGMGTRLSFFEV